MIMLLRLIKKLVYYYLDSLLFQLRCTLLHYLLSILKFNLGRLITKFLIVRSRFVDAIEGNYRLSFANVDV